MHSAHSQRVSAPHRLFSRRSLRWTVPVLGIAIAAAVGTGALSANADPNLPNLTAAQLLAAIEQSHVAGFSGTVVENASLGLPELPDIGTSPGGSSLTSLLTGSHTMRVWYAGPTKQRFALLDTVGETDIFRNGTSVWQWDSDTHTATHTTLPTPDVSRPTPSTVTTLTPAQVAAKALAAIDPTTTVSVDQSRRVASRSAYELVLTPKDATSRVGSVRIAVDGQYKVPLSVQVFARGDTSKPAIDVSFTGTVDFTTPDASNFNFTPPKSATVKQGGLIGSSAQPGDRVGQAQEAHRASETIGTGWTSVVELHDAGALASTQQLAHALTAVQGSWGTGRLFSSKLVTALITDDGRVFVGAVDPDVLYADAASHK